MIPAPRAAAGPLPGDLYLDSAVPECERVTMSRNGWTAQVTHVWTGTGWTRILPGVVKAEPSGQPAPVPRTSPAAEEAVTAWRRRRAQRTARTGVRADERVSEVDVRTPLVPALPARAARVSLPPSAGTGVA